VSASPARVLARKDARELWRDRRLVLATVLTVLLALAAVVSTWVQVSAYERDRLAAAAMESDSWLSQGPRDPHSAAHFSQWAFRPMTAPGLLDPAATAHAGSAVWMEAHARNPAAFRAVEDRVGALELGEFSLAWVIQTLVTLLLIVFAAGAVARERERGTLRLMLASARAGGFVLRGKVLGLLTIAALIVTPLLIAAGAAVALSPAALSADAVVRVLLWCLTHAVLLAIVILIGVAVSARSRSSAAALAVGIGVWVVAVPLAPRAAASLAETVFPTPSGERFWAAAQKDIHDGIDGSGTAEERSATLRAGLLQRYGVTTIEELPISFRGASLDASERFSNRVFERRWAMLEGTEDQQRAVIRAFSVVSPVIAVQNLSAAFAGTDNAHQRDFTRQAEVERQRVVNALNNDLTVNGVGQPAYKADARLWRSLDGFRVQPMPVASALAQVWPDILILLIWLIGAGLLAIRAGRTLRPELPQ